MVLPRSAALAAQQSVPNASAAGTGGGGGLTGRVYTAGDVASFREHYEGVGRYFAERIAPQQRPPGGGQPQQEQVPLGGSGTAASQWSRTRLARFSPRTVELVTGLAAFRVGLQSLEAHRRRRNDELNRDPSDWARVTADRSVGVHGWDSPFPS
jgi:hypothetical protein